MMNIELKLQDIELLLNWAEEATKGNFGLGDDAAGMTYEEEALIRKLKELRQSMKQGKT